MINETEKPEFWESSFIEKQEMWGFEPSKSTVLTKDFFVQKAVKNSLEKGQSFDLEADIITAKGNLKKVRVVGYPEFYNGRCENLSGIFQDITNLQHNN